MFGAACAPKVLVCVCVYAESSVIIAIWLRARACVCVCAFAADLSLLERADRWRCDKKIVGAHVTCVCAV